VQIGLLELEEAARKLLRLEPVSLRWLVVTARRACRACSDGGPPPITKELMMISAIWHLKQRRHRGAWRAGTLASVLLCALLAVAPAGVAATSGASICQYAVSFDKNSVGLASLPPATLKTDYGHFKTLDSKMVPLAPGSIRPDLQSIFHFDLGIFSELSKVGWSFARIPHAVLQEWATSGPKVKPASDKVITYLNGACGLKLTKP
jgi:hypothetical protein